MDDICWTICSLLICMVALLAVETGSESMPVDKYAPKPGSRKSLEKHTDKTIDQLITEALGGIDVASNKILAPGENILAELDMYLSQDQFLNLYSPPSNIVMGPFQNASRLTVPRHKRKAVRDVILRWPRAEIPYQFAKGHFNAKEEYLMKQSMTEWERYTCIKFRPANSADRNILRFQNGEGCNSQLGMVGGVQLLNLDVAGCRYRGLYLHEIGHAIGLVHEHQLPDRDDYIEILYQNVSPQMRVWFNKYSTNMVNQFSVPYEYSSVMHYGITAFSFDGQSQTIRTKDPAKEESVGKVYLKELSFSDVKVASVMYGCSAPCLNPVTCGDGGFLDQNCQCVCPDGSKDCEVSKDNKEVSTDTSGVTDESCINRYDNWKCSIWANYGECERNPLYMETYCTKSCAMCGKSKEKEDKNHFTTWAWQWFGMFANLFPKDWMIGVCKDVYSYEKCSKWKELGDCVTNSKWMGKNCRMTCNQCGNPALKPETSCRNRHSDNTKCDQWALDGECILNSKWMLENCKKSCHACADGTDTHGKDEDKTKDKEEEDDSRCEDKHNTKDCQGWAKVGECSSNPSWMIPNCKKSCAKCDDGICKNLYDDTQCKIWAEDLECMANRIWMHKYCAVSCGVCTSNTTNTGTGSGTGTTTRHPEVTKRPSVTTTKRPGRERCSNLHNDVECDMWAKTGHCDINPSWMYGNCRMACRVCDGTTGNEDTGTTEVCRDREANRCPGWAKYGFCDSNPGYNLIYCKKSCNNCNGCRDEQFLCGVWSKAGHCTTNAGYMLRYCQRSCKTCE